MAWLRFKRAMDDLSEEDQMEVGRRIGSALDLQKDGFGDIPVAKGVGRVERVPVSHGGCISLVHPVSVYRKKKRAPTNSPHLSTR